MTHAAAKDLYWDPFDPSLRDDPYPTWRRLRDEAPVWHNDRYDFWALSRFEDVEAAHRDHQGFSSAHGITLDRMSPSPLDSGMIIMNDPPKHTVLRSLVSRAFTVRRVTVLEHRVRQLCADLLDAQSGKAGFDFVQDFGAIVPPTVISLLLGIPDSEQPWLRVAVDDMFHLEPGVGSMNDTAITAALGLRGYLHDVLKERRSEPQDDMLSALVSAEITEDGATRALTIDEAADFGLLLFTAGTETVARLLGWAGAVLDDHPDQRAELVADPSLVSGAIEELLRFEAPSPVQGRFTTVDMTLHGVTIPAGSRIALLTGSAGRDERRYENPDRFDLHRSNDLHVAFGYGIHFCLGAALARLEGRIGLEEALKRFPNWTVVRDDAELLYTSTVRGYKRLPVVIA